MSNLTVLNLPRGGRRPDAEEAVGDPEEVSTQLTLLLASRSILGVSIEDSAEVCLSQILELVPESGYLVLDQLAPLEGHLRVRRGSRLLVTSRLRGALVRFFTEVQSIAEEAGIAYYRVRWPRMIGVQQRRRHFRVFVPLSQSVPVMLTTDEDIRLQGELRDLSVSGFSARLSDQLPVLLAPGQVLPSCLLSLDGHGQVIVPAELRYLDIPRDQRRTSRIGGEFLRVTPRNERQLEKMVRAIEREARRPAQRDRPVDPDAT